MNIIKTNLNFGNMDYRNKPNGLIYHHAEVSRCNVEDIHQWHLNNGWAGIGYHYFIRKNGSIYKGRPDNAIGSHCKGYNTNTLGICAEGNYMTEIMPQVQKGALIDLGKYLKSIYPINAVYGHGELMATACPGANYPLADIKASFMDGKLPKTGWYLGNSTWYYYSDGIISKNTWSKDSSGRWFYLGDTGAMVTCGWGKDSSNRWFYLGSDGAMVTNTWITWRGKEYYLGYDGAMVTSCTTPDGFHVDADGAKIR